jgi:hypothetical protein
LETNYFVEFAILCAALLTARWEHANLVTFADRAPVKLNRFWCVAAKVEAELAAGFQCVNLSPPAVRLRQQAALRWQNGAQRFRSVPNLLRTT